MKINLYMHQSALVIACLFIAISLTQCGEEAKELIANNKLPVISNVTPAANSLIEGGSSVLLKAEVEDEDGTVSKVEFLINSTVVGEATESPYEIEWSPAASGHYTLAVKATDDKSGVSSENVSFTAVGFSCMEEQACVPYTTREFTHVVTAFYPSWKVASKPLNTIAWESLTHIIYSFALPEEDGDLNTADLDDNVDAVVAAAHEHGVKVYFSIGGANGSSPFIQLAADNNKRALFVDRVRCYIKEHCLDGVDIDWEHWNGGDAIINAESQGLVNLLADLREALPEEIEISVDVYATNWFGKHYLNDVHQHVNYVHAMLYDLRGAWSEAGPHSKYEEVIDDGTGSASINSWGLQYWAGYRQWPAEKIVVGMPFYGRDFDVNNGDGVDYRLIVDRVVAAEADINADRIGNAYYDGPETAKRKAVYARDHGFAGVMFWELTGDSNNADFSLLAAIDSELND